MTTRSKDLAVAPARRLIAAYQAARANRPTSCRFYPSCSAYADEALRVHGLVRGTLLALRRLARCHPFGRHGIDQVPPVHHGAVR